MTDRKLFSSANEAIILFDAGDGSVLDVNEAAVKLYGYPRRDFLRLTAKDLEVETEGGAPPAGRESGSARTLFRRQRKRGGKTFPAELSTASIREKDRPLTMVMTRDITARRRAEAAERVREINEMKRQMVASISHELRTPIAAIKASAETMRLSGLDDEEMRPRFLKIIENQAERLSKLVEDMLTLAEVGSGKVKPVKSSIGLRDFVEDFVPGLKLGGKRRKVQIDIDKALVVRADQSHLSGILQNLIDNAHRYGKTGRTIAIRGRKIGSREARISIHDAALGEGSGLGLHIIKTMIEANGGRIWTETPRTKGPVFHFTLPAART